MISEGATVLFAQVATTAVMLPVLAVLRMQPQVAMRVPMPIAMLELKLTEMRSVELTILKERPMMVTLKVVQVLTQATRLEAGRGLTQRLVTTMVQEVSEGTRQLAIQATQRPMSCGAQMPMIPLIKGLSAPEETVQLEVVPQKGV